MLSRRIIGPIFKQHTLNGKTYSDLLRNENVSALAQLFPNNRNNQAPNVEMWFQYDGTPPHYAYNVRQYLDSPFFGRWIGAIEWPSRFSNYLLWGHHKNIVFKRKPNDLADLKLRIETECRKIEETDLFLNVLHVSPLYLAYCQEVNGQHFKHLISFS